MSERGVTLEGEDGRVVNDVERTIEFEFVRATENADSGLYVHGKQLQVREDTRRKLFDILPEFGGDDRPVVLSGLLDGGEGRVVRHG